MAKEGMDRLKLQDGKGNPRNQSIEEEIQIYYYIWER
jgi:hypothetical protein